MGCARQVASDMDMALAAVDKSLPDAKCMARARRVFRRIEGELTTLYEGDRRTGVAVPTGMTAGPRTIRCMTVSARDGRV